MGCSLIRCNDERLLLLREKYCAERVFYIVISSIICEDQPYSWVRREGRKREESKREELLAKSTDRIVCFHLIYYKA
jgi:hypothetical protein